MPDPCRLNACPVPATILAMHRPIRWLPMMLMFAASLNGCALRPTLQAWGLLEAPPEAVASSVSTVSLRQIRPPEAHRFAVAAHQDVFGSLMALNLRNQDTLSDVARHYGLGYEELAGANPGVDPWVPAHDSKVLLPIQFILPRAPRKGIVINLAAMRLFHFSAGSGGTRVATYPVGIGKEGRSTPTGPLSIQRKKEYPTWYPTANIRADHSRKGDPLPPAVSPGPDNPLGDYALYLSRQPYLIHGTNKPYSIGWRASNGCIRLYPENIAELFPEVPVKEPVLIVNQPYLTGWQEGLLYLQAYRPQEELSAKALQKRLRGDLKKIEAEQRHPLDWVKIDRILEEARGIALPISAQSPAIDKVLAGARLLEHPWRFYRQPEVPSDRPDGWNVLVDESVNEPMARRLAAFLNHQGPPIPARSKRKGDHFQVLAGPYGSAAQAKSAVKRLKVELELPGLIIDPVADLAAADGHARRSHPARYEPRSTGVHREAATSRESIESSDQTAATCEIEREDAAPC